MKWRKILRHPVSEMDPILEVVVDLSRYFDYTVVI
jgi:hypothetical protein